MQVNHNSSRIITNMEAAKLVVAARQRRGPKAMIPKSDAVTEIQALYYMTREGQPTPAVLERQAEVIRSLVTDHGISVDAAVQMVNLSKRIPADLRILMVMPRAETEVRHLEQAAHVLASLA